MLQYLKLENFAIIDELYLDFSPNFNTVTGETGAGKSIIIDAISIACGERCGASVIGGKKDFTKIEICFDLEKYPYLSDILSDYIVDKKIKIFREIYKNGRSVFKVNGSVLNGQTVKNICSYLIDVNGQHEHQKLFSPSFHLELIDNLSDDIEKCKKEYDTVYTDYKEAEKNLQYLQNNQYEIKRNIDLYSHELDEIDKAELKVGEEEELSAEFSKLQNIEELLSSLGQAYESISGEYGAQTILGTVDQFLNQAVALDPKLNDKLELINDINSNLSELSSSLNSYLDDLRENEFDFEGVGNRLDLIQNLKKKYSMSVEEILEYREKINKDLTLFTSKDFNVESLEKDLELIKETLNNIGEKLSNLRKSVAKEFEVSISENLKDLGMNCKFEVDFGINDLGPKGIDDVEFLIAPNPGMPVMSLRKIASGGELSRISLAIILYRLKNPVPLVIFDEIDAGIGGKTGEKIGEKLKEISNLSQVICITHLPQIAAKSQKQINVTKTSENESTFVEVCDLKFDDRVKVIANMFGNDESELSLNHAKELLLDNNINF